MSGACWATKLPGTALVTFAAIQLHAIVLASVVGVLTDAHGQGTLRRLRRFGNLLFWFALFFLVPLLGPCLLAALTLHVGQQRDPDVALLAVGLATSLVYSSCFAACLAAGLVLQLSSAADPACAGQLAPMLCGIAAGVGLLLLVALCLWALRASRLVIPPPVHQVLAPFLRAASGHVAKLTSSGVADDGSDASVASSRASSAV